jgi:hypothetical protein
MHKFIVVLMIMALFGFCYCEKQDMETNKLYQKSSYQKAHFEKIKQINLNIQNDPFIGKVLSFKVVDQKFVLTDLMTKLVYKYDSSGKFVTTIGKVGQGPGEYQMPFEIAYDSSKNIYVCDQNTGIINLYDINGTFIKTINRNQPIIMFHKFLIDNNKNLLYLYCNNSGITVLRKMSINTFKEIYSLKLTKKDQSINNRFGIYFGFCFDPIHNNAYVSSPFDYKIKMVDINTGKIIREFGKPPTNYLPLNNKYYNIFFPAKFEVLNKVLKETTVSYGGMHFLNDKYLLIGFDNKEDKENSVINWITYDLSNEDRIYFLKDQAMKYYNLYASTNDYLYMYSNPREEEIESSNGVIHVYRIVLSSETVSQ